MNRYMAGLVVALQRVQDRQTGLVRKADVKDDGARPVLFGELDRVLAITGHKTLERHFARQVPDDGGETIVVFNDQQRAPVHGQRVPIILNRAGQDSGRRFRGGLRD